VSDRGRLEAQEYAAAALGLEVDRGGVEQGEGLDEQEGRREAGSPSPTLPCIDSRPAHRSGILRVPSGLVKDAFCYSVHMLNRCAHLLAAAILGLAPIGAETPRAPAPGTATASRDEASESSAEKAAAREILSRLDARLRGIASMRGRFVQTFTSSGLGVPQSESGRFAMRRPDRLRWDYTAPEPKIAVSDGEHTWLYLPEEKIVYRGSVAEWKRGGAFAFLAGGSLVEAFEADAVEARSAQTSGNMVLHLRPRSPVEDYESLLVEVNPKTLAVASVTAVDGMGNRVAAAFSGIEENPSLSGDLFTFTPPAGAKIVDQEPAARRP
jgi:outer membrane lipoprotein carrier protein